MKTASALLFALLLSAQAHAASTLIENVRVFDGEKYLGQRNVLISGKKIKDINFHGKADRDTQVIDGRGRTLLPGLIDAHVHAFKDFELATLYGVTTEIDMFAAQPGLREFNRNLQAQDVPREADIYSSGMLATAPNGHGTEYGIAVETLTQASQAQAWVDARIKEGSHFIKIVMEPGSPQHAVSSLDTENVKALIQAAHRRQKLAVVHISNVQDAITALDAGADGLAHLFVGKGISARELQRLTDSAKRHHAFVIPTFTVLESIAGIQSKELLEDAQLSALLSKAQLPALKTVYGKSPDPDLLIAPKQVTAALAAAGVSILAGTDAGNSGTQYGISMHRELSALVEAGLTPAAALTAATSAPAKRFHLAERGRIAIGYLADLLLVEGSPDQHIRDTKRIVEVWKHGFALNELRSQKADIVLKEKQETGNRPRLPANGRIATFSEQKISSPFGMGWHTSSDAMLGGKSQIQYQVMDAQSDGDAVLRMSAKVNPGFAFPWAGLSFFPGQDQTQAVDLSQVNVLRLKIRGDGKMYSVAFSIQGSYIPLSYRIKSTQDWQEVSVPFNQVAGLDPTIITAIAINAGPETGEYQLDIADIRLLRE